MVTEIYLIRWNERTLGPESSAGRSVRGCFDARVVFVCFCRRRAGIIEQNPILVPNGRIGLWSRGYPSAVERLYFCFQLCRHTVVALRVIRPTQNQVRQVSYGRDQPRESRVGWHRAVRYDHQAAESASPEILFVRVRRLVGQESPFVAITQIVAANVNPGLGNFPAILRGSVVDVTAIREMSQAIGSIRIVGVDVVIVRFRSVSRILEVIGHDHVTIANSFLEADERAVAGQQQVPDLVVDAALGVAVKFPFSSVRDHFLAELMLVKSLDEAD